jgi:flagellar biosynthetic protein FliQ
MDVVLAICKEALILIVTLSLPALMASLVVGLAVSLFQAATQIQEQTLTYVPKILTVLAVLGIMGKQMLLMTKGFSDRLYERIPEILRMLGG